MIKKTMNCVCDRQNYIISSSIEYRLFGILLYKKEYFYPPRGWQGEYISR